MISRSSFHHNAEHIKSTCSLALIKVKWLTTHHAMVHINVVIKIMKAYQAHHIRYISQIKTPSVCWAWHHGKLFCLTAHYSMFSKHSCLPLHCKRPTFLTCYFPNGLFLHLGMARSHELFPLCTAAGNGEGNEASVIGSCSAEAAPKAREACQQAQLGHARYSIHTDTHANTAGSIMVILLSHHYSTVQC